MDEELDGENDDEEPDNNGIFTAHSAAIDHYIPALNGFARMGLGGMTTNGFLRRWNDRRSL